MTDLVHNIPVETTPRTNLVAGGGPSAVTWGAILAGGTATAVFSLALLVLGTGLGLASVSPWVDSGVSAMTFGVSAILWITFTQLVSSGLGGYLAGRLRTKWSDTQQDEVHFRDTAHGFLSWCVAALAHAAVLTTVIASIVSGGVKVGAAVATGTMAGAAANASAPDNSPNALTGSSYFVDSLFRGATAPADSSSVIVTEANGIFTFNKVNDTLPADDVRYLGQVVAQRTGLSQPDAEKRVTDTYARLKAHEQETEAAVKAAADKARKATSYAALWMFIAWLSGAFVSSLAATYGGRQRDL